MPPSSPNHILADALKSPSLTPNLLLTRLTPRACPADQVLAEVTRVNSKFTDYTPIELWERSVPLHERVALYSIAQCVLVTATRDGMNLVPYEYVACRQGLEGRCRPAPPAGHPSRRPARTPHPSNLPAPECRGGGYALSAKHSGSLSPLYLADHTESEGAILAVTEFSLHGRRQLFGWNQTPIRASFRCYAARSGSCLPALVRRFDCVPTDC